MAAETMPIAGRAMSSSAGQPVIQPLPSARARAEQVNVGPTERTLSLLGGSALAIMAWDRVGGGGLLMGLAGAALIYRGFSGYCHGYAALGISSADQPGPATSVPAGSGVKVDKTVTIQRSARDLYRAWRDWEALPNFMSHLDSVRQTGPGRTHWVAKGPLGVKFEWDAETYREQPNQMIAWRSLAGSEVDSAGSVHFTPAAGDRATEVRVILKYDPPAGKAAAKLAQWLGQAPEQRIEEDLLRFKQLMEAGATPR